MNLRQFKIKSEAEDSFHVEHPSGKAMTIMKKGLSPQAVGAIKKMCSGGMAEGGPLKMTDAGQVPDSINSSQDTPEQGEMGWVAPSTQAEPNMSQASTSTPNQVMTQSQAPMADPLIRNRVDTESILDQQEQNIQNFQNQLKSSGDTTNQAFKDYNEQAQGMPTPLDIYNERKSQDDQLLQHYMDSKIDPNRYVHNMGTGSKILAGIAMALSGAGAGASGRNMAFEHLQNAINNDIGSQQNDQSKAMNLWRMNRDATNDEMHANLATQNQMWTGVQAKLAMAGANTQNAQAQLNASQLVNNIEQQKSQNRLRMGLLTQGQGNNGTSGADPLNLVPEMVPAEHQKQAITEIGQAQSAAKNQDQMLDLFNQAAEDNTVFKTGAGFLRTPTSMLTLKALGDPLIHDQDGRVNEFEKKDFEGLLPQPGDTDDKIDQKRQGLQMFINNKKSAPTAKAFGINVANFANTSSNPVMRLSPQQQQYYQWAKDHQNNPVAIAFFKKTGLK